MSNFERKDKYLVLKHDDINRFLNDESRDKLDLFCKVISIGRSTVGKESQPNYVVVNENEDYSEKVWELIKNS